jgi:hypothetical protein
MGRNFRTINSVYNYKCSDSIKSVSRFALSEEETQGWKEKTTTIDFLLGLDNNKATTQKKYSENCNWEALEPGS